MHLGFLYSVNPLKSSATQFSEKKSYIFSMNRFGSKSIYIHNNLRLYAKSHNLAAMPSFIHSDPDVERAPGKTDDYAATMLRIHSIAVCICKKSQCSHMVVKGSHQ